MNDGAPGAPAFDMLPLHGAAVAHGYRAGKPLTTTKPTSIGGTPDD